MAGGIGLQFLFGRASWPARPWAGMREMDHGIDATKPTDDASARHEAAHAVVCVRLGLPLAYTTIRPGAGADATINPDAQRTMPPGVTLVSAGYTTLEPGTVEQWQAALPDPAAQARIQAVAVKTAAGMVTEAERGAHVLDASDRGDFVDLLQVAAVVLRIPFKSNDPPPAVRAWCAARLTEAETLLHADGGAAWDRVTAALLERKRLSGDEVRTLVGSR